MCIYRSGRTILTARLTSSFLPCPTITPTCSACRRQRCVGVNNTVNSTTLWAPRDTYNRYQCASFAVAQPSHDTRGDTTGSESFQNTSNHHEHRPRGHGTHDGRHCSLKGPTDQPNCLSSDALGGTCGYGQVGANLLQPMRSLAAFLLRPRKVYAGKRTLSS